MSLRLSLLCSGSSRSRWTTSMPYGLRASESELTLPRLVVAKWTFIPCGCRVLYKKVPSLRQKPRPHCRALSALWRSYSDDSEQRGRLSLFLQRRVTPNAQRLICSNRNAKLLNRPGTRCTDEGGSCRRGS